MSLIEIVESGLRECSACHGSSGYCEICGGGGVVDYVIGGKYEPQR